MSERKKAMVEGDPDKIPGGYGHIQDGEGKSSSKEKQKNEIRNTGIAPGERKKYMRPGEDVDAASGWSSY